MNHIPEHQLELFVLNPAALGESVHDVEEHLAVCAGCFLMVEQIRSFYVQAEETARQADLPATTPGSSLVHREETGMDIFTPIDLPSVRSREGLHGVILSFARRHPVVSGAGAFVALAASLAAFFLVTRGPGDKNPAYVHLNPAQEMLEVYNAEHERLWALPAQDIENTIALERRNDFPCVQVADVDGNGKRGVVSIMRLSEDPRLMAPPLRLFDHAGKEEFKLRLGTAITFHGANYNEIYSPVGVVVMPPAENGRCDLVVDATNNRSPCVIARVSSSGELLGEYWHFGSLYGVARLATRGKESIVAWGTNDLPDTSGHPDSSYAVVMVLDPAKLVGRSESSFTRGFGFPASEAELHYIRLPRSDILEELRIPAAATRMMIERDSVLTFVTNFETDTHGPITFFWSFTKDLRPLEVRSDDVTEVVHRQMVADGRLRSSWGRSYFDSLKARIQFLR